MTEDGKKPDFRPLTGEELKAAGVRFFGERGWQSGLAQYLSVDRTQIYRYVTNNHVPGPVSAAVKAWIKHGLPTE